MASVEVKALSKAQKDELVCTYAALLLHDGELEISVSQTRLTPLGGKAQQGYLRLRKLRRVLLARPLRQGHEGKEHR